MNEMRIAILLLLIAITQGASAQYYFNDIITTRQTNKQYKLLKDNNIQTVTAKSFEADGSLTEGFLLTQEISDGASVITTTTEHTGTDKTISISNYTNNKIKKTVDSIPNIKSTTTYTYNNNDLSSITNITVDEFMNNSSTEMHQWFYENNIPAKMLRIKNNVDTTTILFKKDSSGNITEEYWVRNGRRIETYLYYYDDNNYLTDIVRFNLKAGRLLPDFTFEYDSKGTITQLIQVPQGSDDYLIWKYVYNPNGLKQKELCYNKLNRPVGRIEYAYK